MKFADKIIRDSLDLVFVKRSEKEFADRPEYNSNMWEVEKNDISRTNAGSPVNLYSTPARDVKIGENIYNDDGTFLTYRSA